MELAPRGSFEVVCGANMAEIVVNCVEAGRKAEVIVSVAIKGVRGSLLVDLVPHVQCEREAR